VQAVSPAQTPCLYHPHHPHRRRHAAPVLHLLIQAVAVVAPAMPMLAAIMNQPRGSQPGKCAATTTPSRSQILAAPSAVTAREWWARTAPARVAASGAAAAVQAIAEAQDWVELNGHPGPQPLSLLLLTAAAAAEAFPHALRWKAVAVGALKDCGAQQACSVEQGPLRQPHNFPHSPAPQHAL